MIEDAGQRIELINAYVASQKLVIDDDATLRLMRKRAANELYDIKALLDNNLHSLEKASDKSESYWLRFFLIYPMATVLAKILHVCFFLALIPSVVLNFILIGVLIAPEMVQEEYGGWASSMFIFLIFFLPTISIVLLLRWLAIKFDKPVDSIKKLWIPSNHRTALSSP